VLYIFEEITTMKQRHLAILIAAATVAACTTTSTPTSTPSATPHYWQAGDNVTDTFEQDTAKCELLVEGRYAGLGLASGLLAIPAMEQTFDTCLQSLGWHQSRTETREQQAARCDAQMAQLLKAVNMDPRFLDVKFQEPLMRACKTAPLAEVPTEREQREQHQWVISYVCQRLVAEGKRVSQEECIADLRRRVGNF
jgi:hypothetical protein